MRAISATSRSVECLKIKGKNFKDKEQKVNTAQVEAFQFQQIVMVCKLHERNKIKSQSHWVILIPANTFLSIANISNHKKILNLKRLMLYVLTKARWQMYISCCTDWCELAFVICPPQSKCGTDIKVQSSDMCRLNHNSMCRLNHNNVATCVGGLAV